MTGWGDEELGRLGDKETTRQKDVETRGRGDTAIGRTQRQRDKGGSL